MITPMMTTAQVVTVDRMKKKGFTADYTAAANTHQVVYMSRKKSGIIRYAQVTDDGKVNGESAMVFY